jgi:uridine kinase
MTPNDRRKLRLLRSDLDDAKNPKVLAKYPHLGRPEYTQYLEEQIARLESRHD